MHIEYLRYFLDVASSLSISNTAQKHHMSQQGLSRAIRTMEAEYGVVLFCRSGNGLSLTPAGKEFQRHVQNVINAYSDFQFNFDNYLQKAAGERNLRITIYMTYNVLYSVFPSIEKDLQQHFPCFNICPIELDHDSILDLISRKVEGNTLFFISIPDFMLPEFTDNEHICFHPLLDTELMAQVRKDSSYAGKEYFTHRDLQRVPMVLHKESTMLRIMHLFQQSNGRIPGNVVYWGSDSQYLDSKQRQEDAVGVCCSFVHYYGDSSDFLSIPIQSTVQTPIGFIFNENIQLTPSATEVAAFIKHYCQEKFPQVIFKKETTDEIE